MGSIRVREGRYQAHVRRKDYATVTKIFTSKEVAKRWIKTTEVAIEKGEFSPKVSTTVAEMLDRYKLICLASHKGTEVSEQYRIKLLKNYFGLIPLCDLTPAHLAKYRDERLKLVQPQTIKRDLSILSSAINTAVIEWNIPLKMNPVSMIRWKHTDHPRNRRFEDGEESQLLSHATPFMARMITVAVETAVRRSELLRIKRSHINFSKQTLEIGLTKTGKPRTIPLSSRALKAIKEQLRASDKVIPIEEQPIFQITGSRLFKDFQQLRKEVGIIGLRWHDLRHEATSRLFEKGLNIMEVASITSHQDLKMLKRYTHLRAEDLVGRLG
jgi:integrase